MQLTVDIKLLIESRRYSSLDTLRRLVETTLAPYGEVASISTADVSPDPFGPAAKQPDAGS